MFYVVHVFLEIMKNGVRYLVALTPSVGVFPVYIQPVDKTLTSHRHVDQ